MRRGGVRSAVLVLASCLVALGAGKSRHVEVLADFEAASDGGAAVVVSLMPRSASYKVNETPAPRLALGADQQVLEDRQPPASTKYEPYDPETARYLNPEKPVRFAVAIAAGAPKGIQIVPAKVTFFYCSSTEGWCRRGTEDIEIIVRVGSPEGAPVS